MVSKISDLGIKVMVITLVLSLLPTSPFTGFNNLVSNIPYIGFLNWFLPINEMLVIIEIWLATVTLYYGILYLLNYAGILKS